MRRLALLLTVFLGACGGEPLCGVDEDGEDIPICVYDVEGVPESLEYCPGEHWGSIDGCNSCGCDADGNVVCTVAACE